MLEEKISELILAVNKNTAALQQLHSGAISSSPITSQTTVTGSAAAAPSEPLKAKRDPKTPEVVKTPAVTEPVPGPSQEEIIAVAQKVADLDEKGDILPALARKHGLERIRHAAGTAKAADVYADLQKELAKLQSPV